MASRRPRSRRSSSSSRASTSTGRHRRIRLRPRSISRTSFESSSVRGRTMGRELSARLQQTIRVLRSACILALALGYAAFYSIFPSATFPVSGDASFPWIFLVLALSLPVNLGGAVVGQLLRDRFRGGRFPDRLQS